jgi:hypothetical protein
MAQELISNGQAALVVRNSINSNFTELYTNTTQSLAFPLSGGTAAIQFNRLNTVYASHSVTSAINFTVNATGAASGNSATVQLIANGTNAPTFAGFKQSTGSSRYENRAGILNVIQFVRIGADYWYSIFQELDPLPADAVAPTLLSSSQTGANILLTYSEALATPPPATSAFSATGGLTISSASISGAGLTVGLNAVPSQNYTFAYTVPTQNPIRDLSGNLAAAFTLNLFGTGDPEAAAYIQSIEAADGQPLELAIKTAYETFIVGCKADQSLVAGVSNFAAIKASCILMGARTLAGALVPLVGTAPTNVGFTGGNYNRTTGLLGGSSRTLTTRSNAADPQNNRHIALLFGAMPTTVSGVMGTESNGTPGSSGLYVNPADGALVARLSSSGAVQNNFTNFGGSIDFGQLFLGAVRETSGSISIRAGQTSQTFTVASQTPEDLPLNIFAGFAIAQNSANARIRFFSIGEAANLTSLESRVLTLRDSITAALA